MKRLALSLLAMAASCQLAFAQQSPPKITSSNKVCKTIQLTTGAAYTAGNVVGSLTAAGGNALLTFPSLTRVSPVEAVSGITAVLESVELKFQETHTEEFDISFTDTAPVTVFTDKTAPVIANGDGLNMQVPFKLTNNASVLGAAGTVYGQDGLGRVIKIGDGIGRVIITTPGTPTFTAATARLCLGVLQD